MLEHIYTQAYTHKYTPTEHKIGLLFASPSFLHIVSNQKRKQELPKNKANMNSFSCTLQCN